MAIFIHVNVRFVLTKCVLRLLLLFLHVQTHTIYLIGQKFGGHNCRKFDLVPKILSAEYFCPPKIMSAEFLSDKVILYSSLGCDRKAESVNI